MVYDKNPKANVGQKKPRESIQGKLIGINCDSAKMEVFDPKKGLYGWLNLSVVVGTDKEGKDIYKNVTIYDIDMSKMKEIEKADALLKQKKRPEIMMVAYKIEKDAKDKLGNLIMEEVTEQRGDKEVIVQRPKKWINYRATKEDVITGFKVLKDHVDITEPTEHISEEQIQ